MASVAVFHHCHGLTPGLRAFADAIRAAGHTVLTPDLYEGNLLSTIDEAAAKLILERKLRFLSE